MAWIYLVLAGFFEVAFTTCFKLSNNFTNVLYSVLFVITMLTSLFLLNKSIQVIPLGTAYAVWTGIGAAGTVLVGIFIFREPADAWRMFFLVMLIGSILGLKWVSNSQ